MPSRTKNDDDDLYLPEEDEEAEEEYEVAEPLLSKNPTKPNSNKKNSPARSNQAGVKLPLQKELAEDIESIFGGLDAFKKDPYSVSKVINAKKDIYAADTKLRESVRGKLKYWKNFSEEEYKSLLSELGVWSAEQSSAHNKIQAKLEGSTKQTPTKKVPTKAPTQPQTKPTRISVKPASAQKISSRPRSTSNTTMNNSATNSFTINVNTSNPEANREVSVYEIERIEGMGENKNRLFKGFWIILPIDIRYILDDRAKTNWKARVFSTDTVLLSIQAWDYSQLHDRDQFKPTVTANVLEGIDAAQHDFDELSEDQKEARTWKHLYLKFSGGVELSAKAINSDAGDDEKMKLELIPVEVTHEKAPNMKYTSLYAAWKVARTDLKANKKGKVEKQEDQSDAAKLLDLLAGMNGMNIR